MRLRGTVPVALPPADAFHLFTASGERRWAHGWDPEFPDPGADETVPGTVFVTRHGDGATTWVVASCEPGRSIRYARVGPDRAGTVTVECEPAADGTTLARVEYDLTALDGGTDSLHAFADHYAAYLESWGDAISVSVAAA